MKCRTCSILMQRYAWPSIQVEANEVPLITAPYLNVFLVDGGVKSTVFTTVSDSLPNRGPAWGRPFRSVVSLEVSGGVRF